MKRTFTINEDFENFFASNPPEAMNSEGLIRQLKCYRTCGAAQINFCVNGMRAIFDSRNFEPLWTGLTERAGRFYRPDGRELTDGLLPSGRNTANCRRLCNAVPNHLQFRIDRGRGMGMRIFLSQRMNDVHVAVEPDCQLNSDFWRNHPEFRRAPHQAKWSGMGLDYARPEVYNHFMALTRELLEDFDLDGLELDWLRTPPFFRPGGDNAGTVVLNRYMRETHEHLRRAEARLGHPVELTVRVPSRPDEVLRMGMDVGLWCREGWIRRVAVGGYWQTTDCDIPFEWWRLWLGKEVQIEGALEILCRPSPNFPGTFYNTAEIIAGYAAAMLARGADAIYVFNHMDGPTGMVDKTAWRRIMKLLNDPDALERSARRHVVTFTDSLGRPDGIPEKTLLPLTPSPSNPAIRLYLGRLGGEREQAVLIGFREMPPAPENLILRINGVETPVRVAANRPELPVSIVHLWEAEPAPGLLHDGDNVLEFEASQPFPVAVDWCEIDLGERQ